MKKKFSFFKWLLEIKLRNLKEDEKTIFLANELIKSVQRGGNSISLEQIGEGYCSLGITVYSNSKGNNLSVNNFINGWEVKGTSTFKILEEK